MYNFRALVSFEYKKLRNRKMVWITLAVLVGISIFAVYSPLMGEYYINGELADTHYGITKKNIAQSKELSGRNIDDALFQELKETGKRIPDSLYNFITAAGPQYNMAETPLDRITKEALYTSREQKVRKAWDEAWLTKEEQQFLTKLEKDVEIPMEYQYAEGYQRMLSRIFSAGIMAMLFIAICVPSIFTEEHARKTDQLNLSSCFGKKQLFLAKTFTGITISMAGAAVIFLSMMIPTAVIYGVDGFEARIQLLYPLLSWDMNAGTALCIMSGLLLLLAAAFGAITIAVSEKLKGSTASMALMTGLVLLGIFFSVPPQYRVLAQIWDSLPMKLSDVQTMLGSRMIPFFQTYLPMWKAMPLIYLPVILLVVYFSYRLYSRCQIEGR